MGSRDRIDDVTSWLQQIGLEGADGAAILEGLCERLIGFGVALDRAVVGYLVFHPLFDGVNFTWTSAERSSVKAAATREDIFEHPSPFLMMQLTRIQELRYRLDNAHESLPFPFLSEIRARGYRDYFAFFEPFGGLAEDALWPELPDGRAMHQGVTCSFGTRRGSGFNDDEIALMRGIRRALALTIKVAAAHEMAETLLGAYLGRAPGQSVLRGEVRRGQGRIIHALVWHSDLRGSTELAETSSVEQYLATLNTYFDCIVESVAEQGGEVLKFVGDGVLAIFPLEPGTLQARQVALRSLVAARCALDRLATENQKRLAGGLAAIECGIALHAGDVMFGNVGAAQRLDFTVMGAAVNEAVRLETLCKALSVPIVVSEAVRRLADVDLTPLGCHLLAGVGRAMNVFGHDSATAPVSAAPTDRRT